MLYIVTQCSDESSSIVCIHNSYRLVSLTQVYCDTWRQKKSLNNNDLILKAEISLHFGFYELTGKQIWIRHVLIVRLEEADTETFGIYLWIASSLIASRLLSYFCLLLLTMSEHLHKETQLIRPVGHASA